jgi:pimeloyl-ACP methyl ester carboxylesterase
MAVDAFSLLEAVAPRPRYTLIGVSMGAGVAVRMAELFPARIGKALLIRPAWTHTPNLGHLTRWSRSASCCGALVLSKAKQRSKQSATYRQIAHISAHAARNILSQFDRPHAVARARRLIELPADTPYPSPHTLTTLRCQAAVVGAPDDPLHSLHIAEQSADQLTGGHLDVLPNRDAEPTLYDKMLADVVEKFLSNSTWQTRRRGADNGKRRAEQRGHDNQRQRSIRH